LMVSSNAPVSIPPPTQPLSYTQPSTSSYLPSSSLQSTPIAKPALLPQSPPPPIMQYQQQQPRLQLPPLQQQQHSVPSVGSNLARHNTVAYNNPPSTPASTVSPAHHHHLARSNTVGASVSQRPLHYQQQAPVHNVINPQASAPAVWPQFPSVPTAAPEPTYSTAIPSGFERKEERKEALLIDL
jgi:growth factor-regulated tyrosine kinase substrate